MAVVSNELPKNFRDFNLKDLLLLVLEHSVDVAKIALLLICEKYGENGAACVVVLRDHSHSERSDFLQKFIEANALVDLKTPKYSTRRDKETMTKFAGTYPSIGDAKTYVSLCEALLQEK
jgi:hypothetical protein